MATPVHALLTERCISCHGPEKQKNGLRLDSRAALLAGGDSGPAIVLSNGLASSLYSNVAGLNPDSLMPPKGKGERLTSNEVALVKTWIDAGAPWPTLAVADSAIKSKHWSFQQPVQPAVPRVKDIKWVRNEIDAFILGQLDGHQIKPSPEADRYTLIRRLSLDLTGLPPKIERVESFVNDTSPKAYERQVEELLASPRFGEQWARHWLDLARYADTDGYEKDFYRPHAWRWRNWVIDAINRDQPFDQFTREQLAGDLLPNATLEQKVATGFHRNNLLNREGGVDIEEDRCKIVVDRVSTLGTVWLGLTVGCAECHTHKYDPITQKEFYQLYAFFNSTDDRDVSAPVMPSSADDSLLQRAKGQYTAKAVPAMEDWARKTAALPDIWVTPKVEDYDLPTFGANNGANLYPQEDGSFLVTGMVENKTHYIMMLNTQLKGITGIRVEAMTDEMLPKLGPGWAPNGNFVLSEVRVESASLKDVNNLQSNALAGVVADYSQNTLEIEKAIDGDEKTGWAVDMTHLPMHGVDRCAVFTLKEPVSHENGTRLKVSLVQHWGTSHTLGRVRVTYTTSAPESLREHAVPQRIRDICRVPAGKRTLDEKTDLKRYYQATFQPNDPELAAFTKLLAESTGVKGEVRAQVLAERRTPRPTHVHVRGNFMDKGAPVQRGTLAVLHPLRAKHSPPTRIDLADWLLDPTNPLTARVTVNHIWQQLFGEGLVATVADFGTQGEKPSHPELLDWLATELVKRKWSRKELIRLIVSSSTYRQSSATRPDLADAKNRLLARQNRFRLTAENARDQYLAASGLLDNAIGGPSVAPESKRRGMYVQIKRAHIDYMLTAFDAPTTVQSCPKRERSNTPLQALTLMNDPLFVQCARRLAKRALGIAEDTDARMRYLVQCCVARPPAAQDTADLKALLREAREHYVANTEGAKKIIGQEQPTGVDIADAAAWVVVARAALNVDEVIMRE